jgi:hypothetical protein
LKRLKLVRLSTQDDSSKNTEDGILREPSSSPGATPLDMRYGAIRMIADTL